MRKSLSALFALAALPAAAADLPLLPVKAPVYQAPISTWWGPYAGLSLGGGWGSSTQGDSIDFTEPSPPKCKKYCDSHDPTAMASFPVNLRGFTYGSHTGYNWAAPFIPQIGPGLWLIGAEGDIYGSTQNSTATTPFATWPGFSDVASIKVNALGTVRGRLGYAMGPWLPYVTGGFAWQSLQWSEGLVGPTGTTGLASGSAVQGGWTVGAGLEYALFSHMTARLQFLYIDTGTLTVNTAGTPPINAITTQAHVIQNLLTAGISYRF